MKLNVNIDHFATVRNARGNEYPSPIRAAIMAEEAGADGIVAHLREDRRHIRDEDIYELRKVVKGQFDLEMSLDEGIIEIALDVKPDLVTLVPEKREELTTEGGLDLGFSATRIEEAIKKFSGIGVPVSLFIEPDENVVRQAHKLGADMVELHTGHFADIFLMEGLSQKARGILESIKKSTLLAVELGMKVAAGHGLTLKNTKYLASIEEIYELSIGHALVSDAMFYGLENSVKMYKNEISKPENIKF
ncbi:MAG: pyridoxine 5'-phosphate synthase [Candidatus Kapaibacteriales bacterium]